MTHSSDDKLDPQEAQRPHIQPPIPTHPPDQLAQGDADKIVGPDKQTHDPHQTPAVNTATGSGPVIDQVGGPGLGEAPGSEGKQTPATARARAVRADDPQDQTDQV